MGFSRYSAIRPDGLVFTGEQRATLVRRTYSVVLGCVFATIGGAWLALQSEGLLAFSAQHYFMLPLASIVPLWMAGAIRNISSFQRLGLVALFAILMGVAITPGVYYASTVDANIPWQAGVLTASSFSVLTVYAWLSKRDFSAWGGFFFVGLWILLATGFLNFFFENQTANLWLAGVTVFVFSGLLVFDTWRLRNVYGPDEYVAAAVMIYLDLLNMFMAILTLLTGNRRST